ncbi:uncharacterized protein cd2 [Parambassis ranga]|uniref:Uncharacterized protein cd2 n=1 Tax=Parambassis ranga TaxID=210632 RepID=A0A6P7JI09_9TELE|nr:uncharacterized protein LOC114445672 [Parambassis ranga]
MRMAPFTAVAVLLLCCSAVTATEPQDKCTYVAVGANFTVPLNHPLTSENRLRWNNNGRVIYDRSPDKRLRAGKAEDILDDGSLNLRNLSEPMSGLYTPEVYLKDGKLVQDLKSLNLCVIAGVKKPNVTMECQNNNKTVKFTCMTEQSSNPTWLRNNNVLNGANDKSLKKDAKNVATDFFTCQVSNAVSTLKSDPVTQNCYSDIDPYKLFGLSIWIFVGSGAGIVVVLIIVVIACCVRAIKKKRMRQKDEEELRLEWANSEQEQGHHHHHHHHPPDHHHHHQQQQHQQQQPAGHTGPRKHRSQQPRKQQQQQQQRPRAPDPTKGHPQPTPRRPAQAPVPTAKADDNEQPPPLPNPRKKGPRTKKV